MPLGAVKNAMQRDELDPSIMDLDPEKSVASQLKDEEDTLPLKDDPLYIKYFKMLKMVSLRRYVYEIQGDTECLTHSDVTFLYHE